ncbi:MAG: hypothetical protein KBC41_03585 [Candidatus Pacebacteria bacterium]|nr:hypothetical protein [Candidatus Paceibacterota bacterium]MBP9867128.1 hypothetical protein [Candidatus Paceibacterota bacterium]
MKFSELTKHHAVLLYDTNRIDRSNELFKELLKLSPVHRFFNQTVLDIETARNIIIWANTPYNEEKIGLISFHTIGLEAQNALLKILEEPRKGVRFILITSNVSTIIPTVLSRVLLIKDTSKKEETVTAEIFLKTMPSLRMKLPEILTILSQVDEEERKDREVVKVFILSLATLIGKSNNEHSKYVKEILDIASFAADPSVSGKALLEYLSLLLPQIKR